MDGSKYSLQCVALWYDESASLKIYNTTFVFNSLSLSLCHQLPVFNSLIYPIAAVALDVSNRAHAFDA